MYNHRYQNAIIRPSVSSLGRTGRGLFHTAGVFMRNPLGLRFLRRFRLARTVEVDRLANKRLEGGLVNFFFFVDVDRAACVSVETRAEETRRILQRRALGEGKLHDILVGFASADDAVVRPNRSAHPLPLLDDVRVCFFDELAHSAEGFPAPVPEFGDSFRDELRCRLALARARLFHILILEVPDIFHLQDKSLGFPPLCALPLARARPLCGCDPWNQAGTAMESNNGPLLHFSAANSPVVFLDYSLKNFRCG